MGISLDELQLAARNHGLPLEALRYPVTPVGLHYLLTHFDVPEPPSDWRLEVGGHVTRELSLSLDDLRARPPVRAVVTMECAGNGRARFEPRPVSQPWLQEAIGTGEWGGVPLRTVLEEAGLGDRTRHRLLRPGPCELEGRAWSGFAPIAAVEVSHDGGTTWTAAELEPAAGRWAWAGWRSTWQAEPGEHELTCRARDRAGNEQPLAPEWNVGGYANNAVQRVPVTVKP